MTTLLYRGQNYVQHKDQKAQKDCVELTYRRNHYNTCRSDAKSELNTQLAYRGHRYQHQFEILLNKSCQAGLIFLLRWFLVGLSSYLLVQSFLLLALINFACGCCRMITTFFIPKLISSFIGNRVREVMHCSNIT